MRGFPYTGREVQERMYRSGWIALCLPSEHRLLAPCQITKIKMEEIAFDKCSGIDQSCSFKRIGDLGIIRMTLVANIV